MNKSLDSKYNNRLAFWIIICLSFVLRLICVLNFPYYCSPHDLGTMLDDGTIAPGHLGFIEYFYNYRQLPDFDLREHMGFYNPPLYHMISAVFYGLFRGIGLNLNTSLEVLQFLPFVFCTISIFVVYLIIKEFELSPKLTIAFTTLAAFYPPIFWLSFSLSSDALALLFMLMAILFTVRWHKNQSVVNILGIALSIGLGMMTKLNVAYVAFSTAFIFLYVLIRGIKEKNGVPGLIRQYVIFGCVCVPLGLWWPIRSKVLFDIPLNYIPRPHVDFLDISGYSLWERFGLPSPSLLESSFVTLDKTLDYNVWWSLAKSFMFDESQTLSPITKAIAVLGNVAVNSALLLFFFMTMLSVFSLCKKGSKLSCASKIYLMTIFIPIMISYIIFNIDFPFICTISARYIASIYIVPLVFSACALKEIKSDLLIRIFTFFSILVSACLSSAFIVYSFTISSLM